MRLISVTRPLLCRLAALLLTALAGAVTAAPSPPPPGDLPPGISVVPLPATPPVGYAAQALEVDWTHPLLAARLIDVATSAALPPDLERAERLALGIVRLQLSEPVAESQDRWRLALPLTTDPAAPFPGGVSWFGIAEPGRWLPGGAALADDPESASPLAEGGGRAGVRWLGRGNAVETTLPSLEFESFALLSLTTPATGHARYLLIQRINPGPGRLGELRRWLAGLARPDDWVALHAMGPHAWVGWQGWRLTGSGDPRRAQRLGGVLELRALQAGEPVDWIRLRGATVQANSFERDFPPMRAASGLFWPVPLDPAVWISRPLPSPQTPPWIGVEFTTNRPIAAIRLTWADAAGWSDQFRPARCLLQVETVRDSAPRTVAEFNGEEGPVAVWRPASPLTVHRIRVLFPEPSHQPLDPRARLAGLEALGPWDGQTPPRNP